MNPEPGTDSEVRLPLTEHLDELRKRLIRSLGAMGLWEPFSAIPARKFSIRNFLPP